jgi:hypothetical protein
MAVFSARTLAACAVVAALVAVAAARPAEQSLSLGNIAADAMPPTTLLAQDLEFMAQQNNANKVGQAVATTNSADRPVRASPLAHIIADIIDVSQHSFFASKIYKKLEKSLYTHH